MSKTVPATEPSPPPMGAPQTGREEATGLRVVSRVLLQAIWRYRGRTVLALALLIVAKLSAVAVPLVLKEVVDRLGRPETLASLPILLLAGYALLRFVGTLLGELRDLVFARVMQVTLADFMLRAFAHLHGLGAGFHVMRHTGAVTRDIDRGVAGLGFLLGVVLFTLVPTVVEIGAVLTVLLRAYSPAFGVLILITFCAYGAYTVVFTRRRSPHQRARNELDSSASSRLVDSLLNYETVKVYTAEQREVERFAALMDRSVEVAVLNQRALSVLHIGQSLVIALGVGGIMLLAGRAVLAGSMTVGDLVLVNAYVIQLCLPLNALGYLFREAADALVNAERLLRLMAELPEGADRTDRAPLQFRQGAVRFEHVSFAYEPGRPILRDVSLVIPPGRTVAVVGSSGSGKSTLARLLLRFYELEDTAPGHITIDGQDIRAVTHHSLRKLIGIVPQDTILFNDTIRGNIAYGRADATRDEVMAAARGARVHDFIMSLPEGYDTVVGERGVKLSGGEKQRIAIARALLKNAPILIFDEATSALDTLAERAIQDELDRLATDRTTLVIAHRLSTVVNADEIIVLEHGQVVERGTHAQLLAAAGLYAQMWTLQQQEGVVARLERKLGQQAVDLVGLLGAVLDALRPALAARAQHFYSQVEAGHISVTADPGLLQHMVHALCARAVAVTPPGGRVEVRLERAGPAARLVVRDSAPLPLADDSGVADNAGSTAAPGLDGRAARDHETGADLALDISFMTATAVQFGGSFSWLANDDGGGHAAIVELPLRAVASNDNLTTPSPRPAGGADLTGMRVLVIDDNADARELLTHLLGLHGAQVEALASGRAALAALAERARSAWPDVLLCDVALGDEDGFEVLRALRAMEARRGIVLSDRLPAIALSGHALQQDRVHALLAGFQVYLSKPVEPRQLLEVLAATRLLRH